MAFQPILFSGFTTGGSSGGGGGGGVNSIANVGSTPNAQGGTIVGTVLTLQPADGTHPGLLTSGVQSIGGNKTFTGSITASNLTGSNSGDVTLGTGSGLSLSGQQLSLSLASTSTTGALSSTDWNTFNSKQSAGSYVLTSSVGAANGVASLDGSGKIPVGQLSSVVMEYQGAWNPNTNTPTLSDGTGTNGYVYYVTAQRTAAVAGLTDPSMVNFQIGDLTIYSSSIGKWQLTTPAAGVSSVNGSQGAVIVNAINQLTGDVTTSLASQSQSEAASIAAIQGNTVGGTTGTGNVVFSASPTFTGAISAGSAVFTSTISASNFTGSSSGTNTGDQTITLTGAVTGTGTGSFATTLTNSSVTGQVLTGFTPGPNSTVLATDSILMGLEKLQAQVSATSTGTVTSVGLSVPAFLSVANSPITTSGTLAVSFSGTALPVANGGTNSTTALNSNRIMVSNAGSIVEASALTNGQLLIGSTGAAPVAGNITAGTGITVSNTAGGIMITASAVGSPGDIPETSFIAADAQASPATITGFAFSNAVVRSFQATVSIVRNNTYAVYTIYGIQKGSSWEMSQVDTGDSTGIIFSITTLGQVQYTSTSTGFTSLIKFRAITTSV
jgi:hypothetical protein